MLWLARRYGILRLEAACTPALELRTTRYAHLNAILVNGRDQVAASAPPPWTSPPHEHVRGSGYYQ